MLGDGAASAGALRHEVSASMPGVAYVLAENGTLPQRVRAAYVADEQIREATLTCFAPKPRPVVPLPSPHRPRTEELRRDRLQPVLLRLGRHLHRSTPLRLDHRPAHLQRHHHRDRHHPLPACPHPQPKQMTRPRSAPPGASAKLSERSAYVDVGGDVAAPARRWSSARWARNAARPVIVRLNQVRRRPELTPLRTVTYPASSSALACLERTESATPMRSRAKLNSTSSTAASIAQSWSRVGW